MCKNWNFAFRPGKEVAAKSWTPLNIHEIEKGLQAKNIPASRPHTNKKDPRDTAGKSMLYYAYMPI